MYDFSMNQQLSATEKADTVEKIDSWTKTLLICHGICCWPYPLTKLQMPTHSVPYQSTFMES